RILGNLDAVDAAGRVRFCQRMNEAFAAEASREARLLVNDQAGVAAMMGLELARSVAAIFRAIYGRSRKCLVLDLDNTLWGGVIGDDGVDRIRIGKET